MEKRQPVYLNIRIQKDVKKALGRYAESQGESISVVVRNLIKEELSDKGYLSPISNIGDNSIHNN